VIEFYPIVLGTVLVRDITYVQAKAAAESTIAQGYCSERAIMLDFPQIHKGINLEYSQEQIVQSWTDCLRAV